MGFQQIRALEGPNYIINCDKTLLTFDNTHTKCRKHSRTAHVFYISLVFSNAHQAITQCITRHRLLYLLTKKTKPYLLALQAGEAEMSLSKEKLPNMGVTRFTAISKIIIIKMKAVSVGSKLFP